MYNWFKFFFFLRFPFDSTTLIGYLIAVALEYVSALELYIFFAGTVSLGIGSFLFCFAITDDIKNNFNSIKKIAKTKRTLQLLRFHKKISHSIQLHLNAKQFSGFQPKKKWRFNENVELFLFLDCFKNSPKNFSPYFCFCLHGHF